MTVRYGLLGAAAIAAMLSFSVPAGAVTYQFTGTPSGSSDGSVDATATFTLGAGTLTIVLTDLLANPTSDGQLVSGVSFTASGAAGSGALTTVNSGAHHNPC